MVTSELFKRGEQSFRWAKQNMPAVHLAQEYVKKKGASAFKGKSLAASLHVSKETAVLLSSLKSLGLGIRLAAANPLSSQEDIIAYLNNEGIDVRARRGESIEEYKQAISEIVKSEPDLIIDDGGELHVAYSRSEIHSCIGGTDETTSGTQRLIALDKKGLLRYPVITVNKAKTKYLFDNRYGTGQSSLDGILRATDLLIAGKTIVVLGYGWVGKGVALRARGLGANVIVTEVDPLKAIEAHLDGYTVKRIGDASLSGDIFLTCTGQTDAITRNHLLKMKEGAILANCGHFDREINVQDLKSLSTGQEKIRDDIDKYRVPGKTLYLLCEGRVVNLVAASGHPPEIMQFSFANQLLCLHYLVINNKRLSNTKSKVLAVPEQIDKLVSQFALKSFNLKIDSLTDKQKKYASSYIR